MGYIHQEYGKAIILAPASFSNFVALHFAFGTRTVVSIPVLFADFTSEIKALVEPPNDIS